MITHTIADIAVHLVSLPVAERLADATRRVESIGDLIVRVTTWEGLESIGVTYHEVGGETARSLIEHTI